MEIKRREIARWWMACRPLARLAAGWTLGALVLAWVFSGAPARAQTATCGATVFDLTAGQSILAGSVTVENDLNNLYVTYALNSPGAAFGTLHLWIGNDFLNMPRTLNGPNAGTPIPGRFPYQADATGLTSYTFTVPFTSLLLQDANGACGQTFYVVAHAEVDLDYATDPGGSHETAFAGPIAGQGNRWWFYGNYTVCCDFGPPVVSACETAFAKGGYIWTTDKKSNPENLPSLALTRNRWGWASKLMASGTYTFPLYAGAGLNDISRGARVGTVTAVWNGSALSVGYAITASGYFLKEMHLYAGDGAPQTIAPGQYGNTLYLQNYEKSATFTVPLVDSDGNGVWMVAHAVVCK